MSDLSSFLKSREMIPSLNLSGRKPLFLASFSAAVSSGARRPERFRSNLLGILSGPADLPTGR